MFPLSSQIADRNEQKVNVREKQAYAEGRKEGGVGGGEGLGGALKHLSSRVNDTITLAENYWLFACFLKARGPFMLQLRTDMIMEPMMDYRAITFPWLIYCRRLEMCHFFQRCPPRSSVA